MKMPLVKLLFGLCVFLFPNVGLALDDPLNSPTAKECFENYTKIKKGDLEKFCKQHLPEFLPFLSQVSNQNSDLFETAIYEVFDLYEEYRDQMADGETREAEALVTFKYGEFRSWMLGMEIRKLRSAAWKDGGQATTAEIERKEAELYQILEGQYQMKLAHQKREFEEMSRELAELERALKKREALKDQIIRRRILEITGDEDVMDWD